MHTYMYIYTCTHLDRQDADGFPIQCGTSVSGLLAGIAQTAYGTTAYPMGGTSGPIKPMGFIGPDVPVAVK